MTLGGFHCKESVQLFDQLVRQMESQINRYKTACQTTKNIVVLHLSVVDLSVLNTDFTYLSRSQDHRMVEAGRNLQSSSSPAPQLKLGQLCSTMSRWHLIISKDLDSTTSGQTMPVKQYFLTFRGFLSAVSSPVSGQHWKEPGIILFAPSCHIFIYTDENPTRLVFRLNSPSSRSLSSQDTCSSPCIKSIVLQWTLSSSSFTINLLLIGQAEKELYIFLFFLRKMHWPTSTLSKKESQFCSHNISYLSVSCLPDSCIVGSFAEENWVSWVQRKKRGGSFLALLNSIPPTSWRGSMVSAENAKLLEDGSGVSLTLVVGKDRLVPWTHTSSNCCWSHGKMWVLLLLLPRGRGPPALGLPPQPAKPPFPGSTTPVQTKQLPKYCRAQFFQVNGSYLNLESLLLVSFSPGEGGGKRVS